MLSTFVFKNKFYVLLITFISTVSLLLLNPASSGALEKTVEPFRFSLSSNHYGPFLTTAQKKENIRSSVIEKAKKYIGIPYVAYASNPSVGFDCSGFTMYVYSKIGVNLPHSASEQASLGYEVSESDAQAGDLVYMSGHIGFWVSPGVILDSPKPGYSISIRKIWTSNYKIIRIKL